MSRQQSKECGVHGLGGLCRSGLVMVALVAVSACSQPFHLKVPSADGPTISALEMVPGRTRAGCAVAVRFHFESPRGPVARAFGESTRVRGRGRETRHADLAADLATLAGKPAGDVAIPVSFASPGEYWYAVQVEDEHGRRSNVLEGRIVVDGQAIPPARPCPS